MADQQGAAGSVYVKIDGDLSPLLAKYQQAETLSRASGQKIASSLGSGFQQATGIVDQFGRAVSSGVITPLEEVVPVADKAAASVLGVGRAAEHVVPEMAAMSGAVRVAFGEQSIRAVERFATSILGLGPIVQAAFPLIGAFALGEMVMRVVGNIGKLSEAEKEAAASTKKLDDEMSALNREFESGMVERATLEISKLAGLKVGSFYDATTAAEDKARLATITEQLKTAKAAAAQDVGAASLSSNPLIAAAQALNPTVTVSRLMANEDWKQQTERAKELQGEVDKLTEKVRIYDDVTKHLNEDRQAEQRKADAKQAADEAKRALEDQRRAFKDFYENKLADMRAAHEVTRGEELRFRQQELADAAGRGAGFAPVTSELHREVGTISQESMRGVDSTAREGSKLQVEQAKKDLKETQTELTRLLEDANRDAQKIINDDLEQIRRATTEARRAAESGIRGEGIRQSSADEVAKLRIEQLYRAQIVHSRADELQYAEQISAAEERAISDRIDNLKALKDYQVAQGLADEANATDLAVEREKAALLKQQITDQTKLADLRRNPLAGKLIADAQRIPDALGGAIAGGVTGGNIGRQVADAMKGIGKQMFGDTLSFVIKDLIVKTGLQTVATNLMTAIFGAQAPTQIAATTANTAATVALTTAVAANTAAMGAGAASGAAGGVASVASSAGSSAGAAATGMMGPIIGGVISGVISAVATFIGDAAIIKAINRTTAAVLQVGSMGGGSGNSSASSSVKAETSSGGSILQNIGANLFQEITGAGALPVKIVSISPFIGVASALSIFGFAGGGRPPMGVPSIVGENGPELFVPDVAGTILPRVPSFGAGGAQPFTASQSIDRGTNSFSVGAIHLHGVRDVREMARRLPDVLKSVSPKFSPASS